MESPAVAPGFFVLRGCHRLFAGFPPAPESVEQLSPPGLADELDVADQLRAALAPLQHDLAVVKGLELRPMTDADQRVFSGCLLSKAISLSWLSGSSAAVASSSTMMSGLCRKMRANARRCFSPPDSVWSQGASSSMRSMRCSSPTRLKASATSSTLAALRRVRIGRGAAQRADRDIGPLRQQHQLRALLDLDRRRRPTATGRRWRAPACSCRCPTRRRSARARRA